MIEPANKDKKLCTFFPSPSKSHTTFWLTAETPNSLFTSRILPISSHLTLESRMIESWRYLCCFHLLMTRTIRGKNCTTVVMNKVKLCKQAFAKWLFFIENHLFWFHNFMFPRMSQKSNCFINNRIINCNRRSLSVDVGVTVGRKEAQFVITLRFYQLYYIVHFDS